MSTINFLSTFYDDQKKELLAAENRCVYNLNCSIGNLIQLSLRNWPKNICQISDNDGKVVTNQEALTWAIRIAHYFKEKGFTHNDVIGIIARNTTYVMPLSVACFFNTTPFHAVNPILDTAAIANIFTITKPKLLFCDSQDYDKVLTATNEWQPEIITLTGHIETIPTVEDLLKPVPNELFYTPIQLVEGAEQIMAILCSSGTTGLPKAVCFSNGDLIQISLLTTSEDVIYASSGLDWLTGLVNNILTATAGCTRIISDKPFSAESFIGLVEKYNITVAALAPWQISVLMASPLATAKSLKTQRLWFVTGGWVSPTTFKHAQELMPKALILNSYGSTETGAVAANVNHELVNSVGKLFPGTRVRIVGEDGQNLGHNEVGEIFVHNGKKWRGYYGNPTATQSLQDSNGWFHTGDLGYFDDNNNLYMVDRKRETLKYKGMQYWPNEIEKVIAELPEVQHVCVVGNFDETNGDTAGALVIKQSDSKISEQDIKDYVTKRLNAEHKKLHAGVRFVESLPQNQNGKIVRMEAKKLFIVAK